jgi:BirA family biotin operon repressor/biotin-[acetyl-CoA-carboxylase] ligase
MKGPYGAGVLDAGAIAALAATRFGAVTWLDEVVSTNDEVAALARAGAPEGVVVVADRQTRGRGRRGRTWEAPAGSSLLVSVLLRPATPHLAVVAAGLAAADACRSSSTGLQPTLKWPNDLVVDGRGKLAGILAEAAGPGGRVVVGLGLNVDWGDTPLPAGATSFAASAGGGADRSALLVAYLVALESACRQSPDALMTAYRAACSTIGQPVMVQLPGGCELAGVAEGIDDHGRLIVAGHAIAAGDVIHLR